MRTLCETILVVAVFSMIGKTSEHGYVPPEYEGRDFIVEK